MDCPVQDPTHAATDEPDAQSAHRRPVDMLEGGGGARRGPSDGKGADSAGDKMLWRSESGGIGRLRISESGCSPARPEKELEARARGRDPGTAGETAGAAPGEHAPRNGTALDAGGSEASAGGPGVPGVPHGACPPDAAGSGRVGLCVSWGGQLESVWLAADAAVREVAERTCAALLAPPEHKRFVFKGRLLDPAERLDEAGVRHGSVSPRPFPSRAAAPPRRRAAAPPRRRAAR
jgi:hypothetical protein